ncbi:acetyl-CoA synthetase-like protein [Xylariaceae sp. AK1471]|nr:acetyl-CoA synthetase-like protein [Xylariaceae sp. AK1471]
MAPSSSYADNDQRLMPVIIDDLARDDPHRPWASVPIDDNELSKGYEDISYEVLANAINKLAWIIDSAVGRSTTFETMAYLGASDLRYHMVQMAALKTGHKVLFSSHLNSLHVHLGLMEKVDCKSLFYSAGTQIDDILAARPMVHALVPDLDNLLDVNDRAEWYPYTKTYKEAAFDPYMCLHTSGTTGDPKPILFNHAIINSIYAQRLLPDVEGRSHVSDIIAPGLGVRVLMPVSPFHAISSTCAMCLSILGGAVFVQPCRNRGMSLDDILDVFTYSKAKIALMMPYIMEAVAKKPNPQDYIKAFEKVLFGGGELSPSAQKVWAKYARIQNLWGSNEMGFPPELESDPEDHEYVFFDMEHSGLEFREVKVDGYSDDIAHTKFYEMVLTWTPKSAPYSAHFAREGITAESGPPYPEYRIGDLWTPHPNPDKSRYVWRFVGRIDDLITLAAGINLSPGTIEEALMTHRQVKAVIVIGNKRLQPLVLLELVPGTDSEAVHEIWKSVLEPLNAKMQSHARIAKTHMLIVPADGLERTPKGTISRVRSERKYLKEIEAVYQKFGDVWQDKGRPNKSKA